jgi:hypothetical protein
MRVKTFFRNYMLIPVVLIPFFTIALFLLTWQGGLSMSLDKALLPIVFALPVAISFLVVSIVVIVRLARKRPVRLLLQVLIIEVLVVVTFFLMDYEKSTWKMNQWLYQEARVAFVQRIQSPNLSSEEKTAMDTLQQHRNWPVNIQLHGGEFRLQNRRNVAYKGPEVQSAVTVMRDCDGALTVEFVYDGKFLGSDYAILYSDKSPKREEWTSWDENNIPREEVNDMIGDYSVIDTLSSHWYYVECRSPWSGMFNFGGSGGGWSSGCK